jgi:hypothetical protein
MNTMNMPGFTAEASLSKQGKFYRLPATYVSDSFGVQPQLRKTDFECVHDCLEAGGGDICNFFCTENVDPGGGGGGGQQCRPSCGPCTRDPDSRTGRSRLCINAKCDDFTRRC